MVRLANPDKHDADNPEWMENEFMRSVRFDELTMQLQSKLKWGPLMVAKKESRSKEKLTVRLSPEALRPFIATGPGWYNRVDIALKEWLKTNDPSKL